MRKIIWGYFLVVAMGLFFVPAARAELSAADKAFLTGQCQISQEDVDIIPKLSQKAQDKIAAWIAAKDTKEAAIYKNSRDYYRILCNLKPDDKYPLVSAPGWHDMYLTGDEYENYLKILEKS